MEQIAVDSYGDLLRVDDIVHIKGINGKQYEITKIEPPDVRGDYRKLHLYPMGWVVDSKDVVKGRVKMNNTWYFTFNTNDKHPDKLANIGLADKYVELIGSKAEVFADMSARFPGIFWHLSQKMWIVNKIKLDVCAEPGCYRYPERIDIAGNVWCKPHWGEEE